MQAMSTYVVSSDVLLAVLPFIAVLAVWLLRVVSQRMPAAQRDALQQFTTYAVHMIEQQYSTVDGTHKKLLAEDITSELFRAFKLPVPSDTAINAAIESAVFLLNQMPGPQAAKQDTPSAPLDKGAPHA